MRGPTDAEQSIIFKHCCLSWSHHCLDGIPGFLARQEAFRPFSALRLGNGKTETGQAEIRSLRFGHFGWARHGFEVVLTGDARQLDRRLTGFFHQFLIFERFSVVFNEFGCRRSRLTGRTDDRNGQSDGRNERTEDRLGRTEGRNGQSDERDGQSNDRIVRTEDRNGRTVERIGRTDGRFGRAVGPFGRWSEADGRKSGYFLCLCTVRRNFTFFYTNSPALVSIL